MKLDLLPAIVLGAVVLCWLSFGAIILFRKKFEKAPDAKRDHGSTIGLVLQGLSYAMVWWLHRPPLTRLLENEVLETLVSIFAIATAVASVLIMMAAVRTLGKEWSVRARLVQGHKLATSGPYRFVRHPIYTAMLGMLVGTGLALSYLVVLLPAIVVFFIGTVIRIRSEERLLKEAFGESFEAYERRVAAIIPGLY